MNRRRITQVVLGLLITLGVSLFIGFISALALNAIWPGEARLVLPSACPDSHPDMYIVHSEYGTADGGTTVEDTISCLDERGDTVERSYGWVIWRLGKIHTAVTFVVLVALGVLVGRRTAARRASHR